VTIQATRQDYATRMQRVLDHIQENLDEELGPVELAWFSPHHFHRFFKGMMGEAVMAHIRRAARVCNPLIDWCGRSPPTSTAGARDLPCAQPP
jgi:hypothetical protein